MTKLGVQIPTSTISTLDFRVARLSSLVEIATQSSPEKKIRANGAQLIERLSEWLEEIKDLSEVGDEDVHDVLKSFKLRLKLAEAKIKTWPIPDRLRKQATASFEPVKRRRGRPRKNPIADAA